MARYAILCMVTLVVFGCGSEAAPEATLEVNSGDFAADVWDAGGDGLTEIGEEETGPAPCVAGAPCDDGDPCTAGDFCKGGFCMGEPFSCEDGIECTEDLCLGDGACENSLKPGWCFVDEECYEEGEGNQDDPCLECISSLATDSLLPDDTNECDDGDGCTADDHCLDGECAGDWLVCPDDGNPCTSSFCTDGACTTTSLDGECEDGDFCTKGDYCDSGACISGTAIECDDGNLCTDDGCGADGECVFAPNESPCDDGNFCTNGDTCHLGACVPGANDPPCEDGNQCTDDSCHPVQGCVHFPNNALCDDGDPCLLDDYCVAGACVAGPVELVCTDGNGCTDDSCVPGVGCQFVDNAAPCDDGDVCSVGDVCAAGTCSAGPDVLPCDEGNVCTDDVCVPFVGCEHSPNAAACDDANLCTSGDTCSNSACGGTPVVCNDGNGCTNDLCDPATGCGAQAIDVADCRPKILISWPPRGATLDGDPNITVTGTVSSKAGPVTSLTIGGAPVALGADGSFSHPMASHQGMNLIIAEAVDQWNGKGRTTPSYYFSAKWYPVDQADPKKSIVPDGIMAFLGPQVWDDNDTGDVDDLATVMTFYMKSLDLGTIIQNPVSSGSLGWCTYNINLSNIKYGDPSVDLVPIDGGLHMFVSIPDFTADVNIDMSGFLCFDLNGIATITSVTIDTDVLISSVGGIVSATMANTAVKVNNLNIQIQGIAGLLLNWLINYFEGSFADQIAEKFKTQLGGVIPNAIVNALNSLAMDQDLSINPFLGSGAPITLNVKTGLSSVLFESTGATLGMGATVLAPKVTPHNPLGSIGRAACLSGAPELFAFPKLGQLEIGLHDDFFNQFPYGMYMAGLFEMDVDPAALGVNLGGFGIQNALFHVDFLLAPILTSCTPDGAYVLQIGDMQIDGTMEMFGMPVQMTMFISLEAEAKFIAVDTPTGKQLSIDLGEPRIAEMDVVYVSAALAGAESMIVGLVKDKLVGGFLDSFAGGAFGSFPIPDVDLSGVNPSVPPGSKISLDLKDILRQLGYTVLTGDVKQ